MRKSRVIAVLGLALTLTPVIRALDLPRKSPEFTIQMTNGKALQLSQYRGRFVVLAFILTGCPHCQKAIACLSKDANEFASRGLQVLAAAVEVDAAKAVPGFVRKFNPPFPVGFAANSDTVYDYLQHPRAMVPHMPMVVFIDKDGIIRAQCEGNDPLLDEKVIEVNLRKAIEDLLKGPAAPKADPKKVAVTPKKAS
jgi:peroxiredoxin